MRVTLTRGILSACLACTTTITLGAVRWEQLHAQSGASLSASTDPFHRHRPLEPGDSIQVLRAVRSRQFAFERFRRANFPQAAARREVECDEVIGRFCYNHSAEDSSLAPEPEIVSAARQSLIAALDTAAAWHPGDAWIAGQRIRYLVESGNYGTALSVAEACDLTHQWKCYAFAGYVRHVEGEYDIAENLFGEALHAMPDSLRCEWNNISTLLPRDARARYSDSPCDERDSINARVWWLADPLYLIPGNDRYTEHLARQVLNQIIERAESGYGVYWSSDLDTLVTRFGWPIGWEAVMVGRNENWRESAVVSHHPAGAKTFIPNAQILDNPFTAKWFEWSLDDPTARSRYAPAYASSFEYLEKHQVVPFLRGDSTIVVTAFEWQPAFDQPIIAAASVSTSDSSGSITVDSAVARVHILSVVGEARPMVFSLEALDRTEGRAARVRYGIRPPVLEDGGLALSEILLFEPTDPLPETLDAVTPLAKPTVEVRSGNRIGLYWEIYGLAESTESVVTSVTLLREGRSFLGGISRALGIGRSGRPAIDINWTERSGANVFAMPRSISIELSNLRPGRYTLRVVVESADGRSAVSEKNIDVVPAGGPGADPS